MKSFSALKYILIFACIGCGVKGDPQPPFKPAYIGRGKASYKKVGQSLDIKQVDEVSDEKKKDKK